ncbi:MAG: hypothetical protein RL145_1673, partial [Pseudomonadota bacterium]
MRGLDRFEDGVGDGDEFACDCGEGEFFGFFV